MKTVTYQAPAKVILAGEHSVVYGKPALISAVDIWLKVTATNVKANQQDEKLTALVKKIKEFLGKPYRDKECSISVTSHIPVGRGLGSSAALCVAASAAVARLLTGRERDKEEINSCAHMAEKLFHANPSGADTSASCFGGLVYYRREFEFLKTISTLNMKIPLHIAGNLILIDTGKPDESTSMMVGMVGKRYNTDTANTDKAFSQMEKAVKRVVVAIAKDDASFFSQSLSENQKELERIGVVSRKAKSLLRRLKPWGTGKITGAGGVRNGSGYVLYFARDMQGALDFLKENNISYLPFKPSIKGVERIV